MRWLLALAGSLALASAQTSVTSVGQSPLQGPNIWAGLIITWPAPNRLYATNPYYCEFGKSGTGCAGSYKMMNAEDITLDILSYLQANVYNVGCGTVATYSKNADPKPNWEWVDPQTVRQSRTYFMPSKTDQQMYIAATGSEIQRFAVRIMRIKSICMRRF